MTCSPNLNQKNEYNNTQVKIFSLHSKNKEQKENYRKKLLDLIQNELLQKKKTN
jgi:hypothetical protein